ncbi:MAG: hypothetical protein CME59_10460 [Halioglobus sp.]|nr:hypothetical protein [Halioglobus sp.]
MSSPAPNCTTLPAILAQQATAAAQRTALYWGDKRISYGQLQQRVQRLAAMLAATGEPGARVAVLAWNCPAFVELMYAVPAAGHILVPLNARLAAAELCDQLRRSGSRVLYADPGLLAPLRTHADFPAAIDCVALGEDYEGRLARDAGAAPPPCRAQDPAWILYTSGSTGRPKGAVLTHASFLAGLRSAALARPVEADDRYFYPFPLFHVAAHNVLLQHLYGAAVVLAPAFDAAQTLRACRELGVTTLSLAPTMIAMLLDHPDFTPADLASVRTIGYGASAMPSTLLRRLLDRTGVGLCQSYGMTELSGSVAFLTVEDHRAAAAGQDWLLGSVGRPLPAAELRIDPDSGEILVRAEQCMAGYWQDEEASAQALRGGWLHTGDIGRFDENGYLYIVDRLKDMIISGGENVASREVEEVLRRHSGVRDCAVIGLPDPRWGECVAAVTVAAPDVSDGELEAHCRAHLAGYKTPRRWLRRDALPLNAAGKVDKPLLRRAYGAPAAAPGATNP